MLRSQIPMNSPEGRKLTAVILVISILVSLFALFRANEFDRRVDSGELVELQATVRSIIVTGKGEDRKFDVRVRYTFDGRAYDNVKLSWYTSEMEEGRPTTIYLSPDAPDVPVTNTARQLRVLFYVLPAAALLCFAVAWLPRKKKD